MIISQSCLGIRWSVSVDSSAYKNVQISWDWRWLSVGDILWMSVMNVKTMQRMSLDVSWWFPWLSVVCNSVDKVCCCQGINCTDLISQWVMCSILDKCWGRQSFCLSLSSAGKPFQLLKQHHHSPTQIWSLSVIQANFLKMTRDCSMSCSSRAYVIMLTDVCYLAKPEVFWLASGGRAGQL